MPPISPARKASSSPTPSFEFGFYPDVDNGQTPILIDEALTPDSSRFWPADQYAVGRDQPSFDKQYLRNYLETLAWNKTPPGPALPDEVVTNTRAKYVEAYERLTGQNATFERSLRFISHFLNHGGHGDTERTVSNEPDVPRQRIEMNVLVPFLLFVLSVVETIFWLEQDPDG